jgi:predicted Rossmann fold flavoprotein
LNASKNTSTYDLAIIGAGPAGLFAAIRAAECGAKVVLLEKKHTPGLKLLMTGKERCNITNFEPDVKIFSEYFGRNGKFLLDALFNFGMENTIEFFHKNNVPTKVERGNRVFPESDKARDIHDLLLNLLKRKKITLITRCNITGFSTNKNSIENIVLSNGEIVAKSYLLTTGGLSYPQTGATGDGFKWAKQFGHSIIDPKPSLTPIILHENWIRELEGLSLKNVQISIFQNNKKQDERFGEALFTHNGMTGPIILDMSKKIGELLTKGKVELFIDFKPALDFDVLDKRLLRDFSELCNKSVKNILSGLLPKSLIPIFTKLLEIDPEKKGHSITKNERKKLRLLLKQFPLSVKGLLGFNKAIITSGGISLKEISPKTMSSKIINNLYFAGEILDVDGPTGGFNLQVCWSTGYLAGESAAQAILDKTGGR